MALPKWTEERTAQLESAVAGQAQPIDLDFLEGVAEDLETTRNSVSSKLRKLGYEVAKVAQKAKTFSDAEAQELESFVSSNSGSYTYSEIAAAVCGGKFNNRQVQGKLLAMELTEHVKPTPKQEAAKVYSEAEETQFIELANSGSSIEAIASALGKTVNSIRGKALSLNTKGLIESIPHQENKVVQKDVLDDIDVEALTVEEIAEATGRTERGIKTMLTRRAISCANYDGAGKAAKAASKKEAA